MHRTYNTERSRSIDKHLRKTDTENVNTKQKIVWVVYLLAFLFIWYVEVTPPQNGTTAMGALALSAVVAIPAIILHKILKDRK